MTPQNWISKIQQIFKNKKVLQRTHILGSLIKNIEILYFEVVFIIIIYLFMLFY